jgi:OFA family oxalate/formate antiporter-like MFS transporter
VVIGAGLLIAVIGTGTPFSFGVFFKSIESEFGLTRGATSGIFSVHMLVCCIVSFLGGWSLDRYGPKIVTFLMGSFIGLSLILTSQTNSTWQLLISYGLLLSLGVGGTFPVVHSTASRWFHKKRGLALGITTSGTGLGVIVMALFATYLISHFSWRTAFLVLGVVTWLVIASLSLLMKKEPSDIGLLPDGVKSETGQARIESKTQPTGFSPSEASRTRQFWFLGFVWFFMALNLYLVLVHIVPYAIDMGISPIDAAVILSLAGGASILGRLGVGKVSDTIGRKAPAIACALLQVGALLWLMWSRDLWMFYTFALVYGFMWGGFSLVTTALIGDIFGMRSIGSIMGLVNVGWTLGAAAGPAIGGLIFDITGNYFLAFATGAGAILIAGLLVALVRSEINTTSN